MTLPVADTPTLNFAPALPLWLLIPGILVALGLSIYLYAAQRRLASPVTVFFLALIRLSLIALLAILFLQPAIKWSHTRTTAGTLWLVVDQSPSMQTPDPQAATSERLHWAEGLGYLPQKDRAKHPDVLYAQIHALAGEFSALEPASAPRDASTKDTAAISAFAKRVAAWTEDLKKLAEVARAAQSDLDSQLPNAGKTTFDALDRARDSAAFSLPRIRNSSSATDANNALDRIVIDTSLAQAQAAVKAATRAADTTFLRDNSADVGLATARVTNITRQDLAYSLLTAPDARATKALADLAKKYHLRIAGFSDNAQSTGGGVDPSAISDTLKNALAPSGQSTNLQGALQFVSEHIAADEAASIIILSDGRNNTPGDPTGPARNLAARGVRVFGLLVGSHEVSPDAAVEQIDAPDWIYKGDTLKARALVRLDGLAQKSALVEIRRGDTLLEKKTVLATSNHQTTPIDFSDTPPDSALALEYQVKVSEMPGEVNTQNNLSTFRVAIKKDKLYALFVEDRPRWEYRYLAATLGRDQRMKIQTVLLNPAAITGVAPPAPVKASPDNPRDEAQLLPTTAEEWQAFDIIILGDISPDVLPAQSQQFIAAAVRDKGATLITLAGQRAMPAKFAGSPLEELLPITFDPQYTPSQLSRHTLAGFRPNIAPTAGPSILAQFDLDSTANATLWSHFPLWYWHSPYTLAKPAATVIWSINELTPNDPTLRPQDFNKHALLSTLSFGLGRSLHLAADQSWRLRQVNGNNMHERFWGQVLRWAVGSDLPAGGKYVRFGSSQPVYSQDQPVVITARVFRDDLTPYTGLAFSAVARPAASNTAAPPNQAAVEARFAPTDSPGYYTATLGGLPVGDVEISLKGPEVERLLNDDPTVTQRTLLVKIEASINAERRNMNTDPLLLDTVAAAGAGYSLDAQYADLLLSRIPQIEHTETLASQIGFFTDPAAQGTRLAHWSFLTLFALLLTTEWLLRKRAGLV